MGKLWLPQRGSGPRARFQARISANGYSRSRKETFSRRQRSAKRSRTTGNSTANTDTSTSRPTPLTDVDDAKKIVNLTMEFDQQKQFFVRRIEFSGNTTTRDKVIRRELAAR